MPRFEYMMVSTGVDVSFEDLTPFAHAEGLNRAMRTWLPTLAKELDEVSGGGWEAISHDLLPLSDGIVLSVLARRPAIQPEGS